MSASTADSKRPFRRNISASKAAVGSATADIDINCHNDNLLSSVHFGYFKPMPRQHVVDRKVTAVSTPIESRSAAGLRSPKQN
jgi:hypothetical protein